MDRRSVLFAPREGWTQNETSEVKLEFRPTLRIRERKEAVLGIVVGRAASDAGPSARRPIISSTSFDFIPNFFPLSFFLLLKS